ncbi:MAG: Hsp20/alpha crystallin family protein [Actinomycetota bacterium]|nr:Hsp20/alpha crystallin family protein [Actinomycetota bacterium]
MPLLPARREERAPARWDPFRELEDVRQQVDRVMEQLMGSSSLTAEVAWSPLVDVEETDDAWIVEAEVPGAKRDDITIELDGGELAIHGEIKERERVGILRRRTRRTGQFDYRVRLPGDVDDEGIDANLEGGVLTVHIPKSAQARRRRIEIKGG